MITVLLILLASTFSLIAEKEPPYLIDEREFDPIVTAAIEIKFQDFPSAFNPSIAEFEGKLYMSFRFLPDEIANPKLSEIYLVELSEELTPIGAPQLLDTRRFDPSLPMQSEDARLITCNGKLFIVYNDCLEETTPKRRDIYIAEIEVTNTGINLAPPLKLIHTRDYDTRTIQKNWTPFDYKDSLLFAYTLNPHEVLSYDPETGDATPLCSTPLENLHWKWGTLRGGTPAVEVDGKYLSFFHSSVRGASKSSFGHNLWHYLIGGYTFSKEAPFEVEALSVRPLIHQEFYTLSPNPKRVIFPGGFVIKGETLLLAYGKDDCEIWIAKMELESLLKTLKKM